MAVSREDENRLNAIAEPICHNASHMNTVIINGIYNDSSDDEKTRAVSDSTFTSDIHQLLEIYQHAPVGVRSQLASIIDCVYLLVSNTAHRSETSALQAINQQIRKIWLERIEEQHKTMDRILNL